MANTRVIEHQHTDEYHPWKGQQENDEHEKVGPPFPGKTIEGIIEAMNRSLGSQAESEYEIREHSIAPQTTAK